MHFAVGHGRWLTRILLVHQLLLLLLVLHDGGVRGWLLLTWERASLATWDTLAELNGVHQVAHLLLLLLLLLLFSGSLGLSWRAELVDLGGGDHMVRTCCIPYQFCCLEFACLIALSH